MAAADLHLQGMEDIITCSICQELFTDARSLTCKHCFCYSCLIEFQTTFTKKPCPLCRENTVPAARELHRLPVNTAVNDMVGLVMKHKATSEGNPMPTGGSQSTQNKPNKVLPPPYSPRADPEPANNSNTPRNRPNPQPTPQRTSPPPPPRPPRQQAQADPQLQQRLANLLGIPRPQQRPQPKPQPPPPQPKPQPPKSRDDALAEAMAEAFAEALTGGLGGRRRPPSSSSSSSDGDVSTFALLEALLGGGAGQGVQRRLPSNVHRGIVCDECKTESITGCRYKCGFCDDYDLCERCEQKPRQYVHDRRHIFVKLKRPAEQRVPRGRVLDDDLVKRGMGQDFSSHIHRNSVLVGEILGMGVTKPTTTQCDRCGKDPIVGTRYKCGMCRDYDLCGDCEKNSEKFHDRDHVFIVLKHPTSQPQQAGRSLRVDFY